MANRYQHWLPLMIATALITALVFALVEQGPLRQAENKFSDLRLALMTPRQAISDALVVLTLTEDTLGLFPYRSPVNRHFLARLIRLLNERGAKAIGIDVLFDHASEPEADRALDQALRDSKVPVVLAYADDEHLTPEQQQFLDTFTAGPGRVRGYANLLLDGADGVVRALFPGRTAANGQYILGFAATIAQQMGVIPPTEVLPLRYRGLPPDAAPDDLSSAFKRYPSHLAEQLPAAWLANKIVLIGAELPASSEDMKKTPFAALLGNQPGLLPGVMIHAHSILQLIEETPAPQLAFAWIVFIYCIAAGVGLVLARLNWPAWGTLLLTMVLLIAFWALNFWYYRESHFALPLLGPSLAFLSTTWWGLAYASRQEHHQKLFIKSAFSRYLHPYWVEQLIAHPDLLQLQGERREMTLLFSDIAGFTTLSERLSPEVLVSNLRAYLDGMTQIIMAHGGTVNQYMGDGIVVLFGAPAIQADHALRAIRCALALDAFAQSFRESTTIMDRSGQSVVFGHTRIGVHTGEAIVGNFGSAEKLEYTAIGDVVNTASRLEGLNSHFGTRIAVSDASRKHAVKDAPPDLFCFRPIAQVIVKGKQRPLTVFQPLAMEDPACATLDDYNAAYTLLRAGDHDALVAFLALHSVTPDDPLVDFHRQRIEGGEWSTRIKLTSK